MKISTKSIPNLHPKFFWEFRFDEINWLEAYQMVIGRIVERGSQDEIDEIIRFYGHEKVIKAIRDEIYFLPDYAIEDALKFFPELKKEEMYCYLNRKDKPYHWI
ncbi:DUF6922 domain-containing protein [Flavobacterium sp. HJJ]|uniref:DUF6922 domain-containing protein n=1 Tax=Flavobacterium sp. HJJ TaxID=2783792 RepID=UPI00188D2A10|nr:hypothetical protein [Flavobacterium sp. HJJ]MBF4470928.1 hypothetical protein [Flavobacterium sp. HJJ]